MDKFKLWPDVTDNIDPNENTFFQIAITVICNEAHIPLIDMNVKSAIHSSAGTLFEMLNYNTMIYVLLGSIYSKRKRKRSKNHQKRSKCKRQKENFRFRFHFRSV